MTKAYFLQDSRYVRFDVEANAVDPGYPRAIAAGWKGVGDVGFGADVDAAVDLGAGKVYLLSGSRYVRVDQSALTLDAGYPLEIADQWGAGMRDSGFASGVDAAAHVGGGRVFFAQGPSFLWYQDGSDAVDGPHALADVPGMSDLTLDDGVSSFADGVDGAVDWPGGKVYLFKGPRYARLDVAAGAIDEGYPLEIGDEWPGFAAAGFTSGMIAGWVRRGGGGGGGNGSGSADIPDDFFPAIKDMCARLGCAPVDLLGAMMSESGVKASAINPRSRTVGLIQLTPGNLPSVGWNGTPEEFAQLSPTQQLPFIERYFAPRASLGLGSSGAIYALMFLPGRVQQRGTAPETELTASPEGFYTDNQILDVDHDGRITIADLTNRIASVQTGGRWNSIVSRLGN
jgi:hypothetical protein